MPAAKSAVRGCVCVCVCSVCECFVYVDVSDARMWVTEMEHGRMAWLGIFGVVMWGISVVMLLDIWVVLWNSKVMHVAV